jgi:hypothetical protein
MILPIESVIHNLVEVADIQELLVTKNSYLNYGPTLPLSKKASTSGQFDIFASDKTLLPTKEHLSGFRGVYRLAHLSDAIVTPRSAIVHNDVVISEGFGPSYAREAVFDASGYYRLDTLTREHVRSNLEYVIQPHYLLSNELNDRNIFHFLHIALPRLSGYIDFGLGSTPLFCSHQLSPFQIGVLQSLYGLGQISIGHPDRSVRFKSLYLPLIGQPYLLHTPNYNIHKQLLENVKHQSSKGSKRNRIYISRSDASVRRVQNEDALVKAIEPYGFTRIILSELAPLDQIALFMESEFTIFPFGAGAAFLTFQQPRSIAFEISPAFAYGPHFKLISLRSNLRYFHHFESVVNVSSDMAVEIQSLLSSIEFALGSLSQ